MENLINEFRQKGIEVSIIKLDEIPDDIDIGEVWYIKITDENMFNKLKSRLRKLGWNMISYREDISWLVLNDPTFYPDKEASWLDEDGNPADFIKHENVRVIIIGEQQIVNDPEYCSCKDISKVVKSSALMKSFLYCRNCGKERKSIGD